jgi:NTE family protein
MKQEKNNGLILPGGGARGAYQAGVLKAIAEFSPDDRNPFPIISGVSVGAINAAAVAAGALHFKAGIERLVELWVNLKTRDVFRTDFGRVFLYGIHWLAAMTLGGLGVANPKSLLDTGPLAKLIEREVNFSWIERAIKRGTLKAIGITASSYGRGKAITFFEGAPQLKNWTRARRDGIREKLNPGHILASSSLPMIFPAQKVGHDYLGDGSLRLTSPLSPAIHLGADRILIIGSRDESPDEPPTAKCECNYPSLGEIGGYALDILFNDNLREDIERARRINQTIFLLTPEQARKIPLRIIEVMTIYPSKDIREIARSHAREIPWTIRMLFRGVGAWGSTWQLPSYLLFEPPFCRDLVELGYKDAMRKKEALTKFLF